LSCALFVALSLAGAVLEARYLEATAVALAEREGTLLGRHLGTIYFRPGIFLNSAGDLEIPTLLLEPVREDLKALGIVMLKVYDLRGKIVASTDPAFLGMVREDNPSFRTALTGKTVGKIADREYYRDLYGQESVEDLFELYVPLWTPGRNSPAVVLEIYRPWSLYEPLIRAGILRTGIVAGVLMLVFCLLLVLLSRYRIDEESRNPGPAEAPETPAPPDDRPS
jgi:hypothetical protein